jgi:arylsulfatase A-like enzyme
VSKVRWRSELWRFLELFALCGFVVVQPVLDVVGGAPDFFIFHGVAGGEVLALVAILALVPPVALWGLGVLAGLVGARARRVAHLVTVAGLLLLLAVQLGKQLTSLRGAVLVVVAVLAAAGVVFAYARLEPARLLLRFAAIGPLVFALLFAFGSPSSAVLLADDRPSTGGSPRSTGPHPPIVMIVLDEFALVSLMDETGEVDAQRLPNFARLAADSTWYRNATGSSGWTPDAVPSMLTGRWPTVQRAPHFAQHPDNLFTLLGDAYQVAAWETITELCPPWVCAGEGDRTRGGLPVALGETASLFRELSSPTDPVRDPYDDYVEPTVSQRLEEVAAARNSDDPRFRFDEAFVMSQPVRFQEYLTALQQPPAAGRPELRFLHLLLPHTPWKYFPDGTLYEGVPGLPVDGEWWGRLALQRYRLQLEYTDRLLGEVLDALQETGRYDESLVVLTADHGVSLTPGGPAGARELSVEKPGIRELAWVPMFLKAPGQTEPEVEDRNWQHVDLLPTIADHAGVEVPWQVDGISWRDSARTDPTKTFHPYVDRPERMDGAAEFASILADPTGIPPVPEAPLPELVGTAVADQPVVESEIELDVKNAGKFDDVELDTRIVPALVHGTVPEEVPAGTPVAIALNGVIGAVVPVVESGDDGRRFAGLIADPDLFVDGENRLELFLVPDGVTLHRVSL